MTIIKRIILLACVASLGMLAVGLFGLVKMRENNDRLEYANNKSIPALRDLAAIESNFMKVRLMYLTLKFVVPEAQKPEIEKAFEKARSDLEQSLKTYEAATLDDKDKEYLKNSQRIVGEYLALLERSKRAVMEKRVDEVGILAASARDIANKFVENIAAHAKYHTDLMATQAQRGAEDYRTSMVESVATFIFSFVVISLLGYFTVRHVTQSLNSLNVGIDQIAEQLDFTTRIKSRGQDEISHTIQTFNRLVERLQSSFQDIRDKMNGVQSGTSQVTAAAKKMSQNSADQSESASAMAATMEQLTVSINHVADRARDADSLVRTSGTQAQAGAEVIVGTVSEINGIAETVSLASRHIDALEQQSDRINSVVSVIKEVADQTNLLALNAAIEAARAGEQGRGFAVVADEVRKLAERTTASTLEIATTISEMQAGARLAVESIQAVTHRVTTGVAQAESANTAIQDISQGSQKTVGMVGEISTAIQEQSTACTSIAQQVERIASTSEENSHTSAETARSASELEQLVTGVHQVISQYRV